MEVAGEPATLGSTGDPAELVGEGVNGDGAGGGIEEGVDDGTVTG